MGVPGTSSFASDFCFVVVVDWIALKFSAGGGDA